VVHERVPSICEGFLAPLEMTAKPAAAKTIDLPKLGEPERANGTTGP
jgi:hypothetical protein